MVFYRSKGMIALWINSCYVLVSASWKIKFTSFLTIMGFGTGKIQKQNSELVQMNTTLLISILSVWLVSVYRRAGVYLCKHKCLKIRWCEILDVLKSIENLPSTCQWFQWSQDLCLRCSPAAWWEWVIHTGSAGPWWGWETAQLGTVAFSREKTSALIRAGLLQH